MNSLVHFQVGMAHLVALTLKEILNLDQVHLT